MKLIIFLVLILLLLYAGAMSYLYFGLFSKNREAELLLNQARSLKQNLADELARSESQLDALKKDNEHLKKESLEYLKKEKNVSDQREKLEQFLKKQNQEVGEIKSRLQASQKELKALKQENAKLADVYNFSGNVRIEAQEKELAQFKEELLKTQERLKKQEAFLHYNLGVAYTKQNSYDMAIDEYERALKLNPEDADTHYNLAILYDDYRANPKRAVEHYKKYLELRPDAEDIDEVKEWMERLMLGEVKIKQAEAQKPTAVVVPPSEKIKDIFSQKAEKISGRE